MSWIENLNNRYSGNPTTATKKSSSWMSRLNETSKIQIEQELYDRERKKKQKMLDDSIVSANKYAQEAQKAQIKADLWALPGEIGKDIVGTTAAVGADLLNVLQPWKSEKERIKNVNLFGKEYITPSSRGVRGGELLKQGEYKKAAGEFGTAGLDIATTFYAPAKSLKIFKGAGILKGIAQGIVTGSQIGAGYGLTGGLSRGENVPELAKSTGTGALYGGIGGGVMGGTSGVLGRVFSKKATQEVLEATSKPKMTATKQVLDAKPAPRLTDQVLEATGFTRRPIVEPKKQTSAPSFRKMDVSKISPEDMAFKVNTKEPKIQSLIEQYKSGEPVAPFPVYRNGDKYILNKDGYSRYFAAKEAGIKEVPVIVEPRTTKTPYAKQVEQREIFGEGKPSEEISGIKTEKTTKPQFPVEEGETKVSKFAKRLNEELPDDLKIDEEYATTTLKKEANDAAELLEKDPQKLAKIANGEIASDANTQTAALVVLKNKAVQEGDMSTAAALLNKRRLANTRRGQEIAMEKLSVRMNPEEQFIGDLINTRIANVKKGVAGLFKKMKGAGKNKIVSDKIKADSVTLAKDLKLSVKIKQAQEIFNSLICK